MPKPAIRSAGTSPPGDAMDLLRWKLLAQRHLFGRRVRIWYSSAFRLPLPGLEGSTGFEPRRADYVLWFLLDQWALAPSAVRTPRRVRYRELARVHQADYLETLSDKRTLARIFAVDESGLNVDEVLRTVRLACGATVDAALDCLKTGGSALNLFGGFHHASPAQGGGFCAINDIAVAVDALRQQAFFGQIAVIDLDAHPPDGLADCLGAAENVWVGSLSGESWGPLTGVDDTVLARGTGDATYLQALSGLLGRMPRPEFAFVIAGGDVLAGDRLGKLSLTLAGARRRDLHVREALGGVPTVWLPGGGYGEDSWRVFAGTALVVACRSAEPIAMDYEPMRARFSWVASRLSLDKLEGGTEISWADVEESLGLRAPSQHRFLGFYSTEGLEYALSRYGLLPHLWRLGYSNFRVVVEPAALGDAVRLFGTAAGKEHMLLECVLEKRRIADADVLYVHWLTLRNPRARFSHRRPQLPGQDKPGLGLAREMGWVFQRMARRLGLEGVVFRPAWFHTAYTGRYHFVFVDPARQGRFEAMIRDLGQLPLIEVTKAAAEGRVLMNGEPYTWEADEMVFWLGPSRLDEKLVEAERSRVSFSLAPPPTPSRTQTSTATPHAR